MSRWTIPRRWQCATARASCHTYRRVVSGDNPPGRSSKTSRRFFSTYSNTKYSLPFLRNASCEMRRDARGGDGVDGVRTARGGAGRRAGRVATSEKRAPRRARSTPASASSRRRARSRRRAP
eukprot:30772-Pelagococcus_subviridis.AAC.3